MSTVNPWLRFKKLMPSARRYRATIITVDTTRGTCYVELNGGDRVRVMGTGYKAGDIVMIEDDKIIGTLPDLPFATVEV